MATTIIFYIATLFIVLFGITSMPSSLITGAIIGLFSNIREEKISSDKILANTLHFAGVLGSLISWISLIFLWSLTEGNQLPFILAIICTVVTFFRYRAEERNLESPTTEVETVQEFINLCYLLRVRRRTEFIAILISLIFLLAGYSNIIWL